MDVDVGYIQMDSGTVSDSGTRLENWRAAWRNSGIVWDDSGTSSQHPGTALEDPGTGQPMSGVVMSVEAAETDDPALGVRPVPVWAQPIMTYLVEGCLPGEEISARQIQRRSKAFTIINRELYKRSATTVLQRCVEPEEGEEILRDIH